MPVVPIRTDAPQAQGPAIQPPPDVYTLMAANQMHREGRLLASQSTAEPKPNGRPNPTH